MKKWIVLFTRIPTNYNPQRKAIVEAPDADTARKLVKRLNGDEGLDLCNYLIESVKEFAPEVLQGRVIEVQS